MVARRAILAGVVALAGCAGVDRGTDADTDAPTDGSEATTEAGRGVTESTTTPETDTTSSPATQTDTSAVTDRDADPDSDLDLREANVVGVDVSSASGGYRFDVTLIHDDDGEDGYANWWVVEALDGTELGRRELSHPHGTREFTRSTTVDVRDETCVVVRGHDQTHGYGGRVAVVAVDSGDVAFVDQGPDRRAVMAGSCP